MGERGMDGDRTHQLSRNTLPESRQLSRTLRLEIIVCLEGNLGHSQLSARYYTERINLRRD